MLPDRPQQARVGVVQSDVAAAAVTGQGMFAEHGSVEHLRAAASLFPEPVHVVVRADSGISESAELAGRRVALGQSLSGSRHTARRLLEGPGSTSGHLEHRTATTRDALARLVTGEIDAVIEVVSAPWQQLETAMQGAARLVALGSPRTAARIGRGAHGLVPLGDPGAHLSGQSRARADRGGDGTAGGAQRRGGRMVEATLDLLYATAASGGAASWRRDCRRNAPATGITIPLHPAAARYFAKAGATAAPVADAP